MLRVTSDYPANCLEGWRWLVLGLHLLYDFQSAQIGAGSFGAQEDGWMGGNTSLCDLLLLYHDSIVVLEQRIVPSH